MSYGSKVCPQCGGEVKVYFEGDGSCFGTCPTCGHYLNYGPRIIPSRIPDEGAFYEVLIDEYQLEDKGIVKGTHLIVEHRIKTSYSLAIYTNLEAAYKRAMEARIRDGKVDITSYIKKWNHSRTEWEFVRNEHIPDHIKKAIV